MSQNTAENKSFKLTFGAAAPPPQNCLALIYYWLLKLLQLQNYNQVCTGRVNTKNTCSPHTHTNRVINYKTFSFFKFAAHKQTVPKCQPQSDACWSNNKCLATPTKNEKKKTKTLHCTIARIFFSLFPCPPNCPGMTRGVRVVGHLMHCTFFSTLSFFFLCVL